MHDTNKTFCAYPFYQINIKADGKASLCCSTAHKVTQGNRALSLHTVPFEQIWNSEYMREVRRRMLEGKDVDACKGCYVKEGDGGTSLRQIANLAAIDIMRVADDAELLARARTIVESQQATAAPPSGLHLWLGNLCNLKCRMCSPTFSSQIAADALHSSWRGDLSRSEALLPEYLEGISYTGFGQLEQEGRRQTRAVAADEATITLPGISEAIAEIELAGIKRSRFPCRLTVMVNGTQLARKWLSGRHWRLSIQPEPALSCPSGMQLSLLLTGARAHIDISDLTLTTKAISRKKPPREIVSRIPENPHWFENEEVVFGEVFAHPKHLRNIVVSGGEPLINPTLPRILDRLVREGHAQHIALYITSNGTVYSRALADQFKHFQKVEIGFSLDGIGPVQEYIRPPAKWEAIKANILAFREAGVPISVRPTLQAYNVFGLLDLVRLCQQEGIPFVLDNVLTEPQYLSVDLLPQTVIDEALRAWTDYLETECTDANRWHVATVIASLRRPRSAPAESAMLREEFIRFTNDLDASRNETFAEACPRLHASLVAAGFDFAGKYRFWGRKASLARNWLPGSVRQGLRRWNGQLGLRRKATLLGHRVSIGVAGWARLRFW